MPIVPDKKKAVSVILSKFGKAGETPVKPEEELNEHDGAMKAIAEDILMAIKSESAHDLMMALKAFDEECDLGQEESEEIAE